jgi:hypothetical protein
MWVSDSTMEHAAEVYEMTKASAAVAGTKSRIIFNKGYHGGNRAKDDKLTAEERMKVEACLLCGRPDSQDHWLHHCPHAAMAKVRDEIIFSLNRLITEYRDINPLHRQIGYAFKHVLQTTDQPSRIWTANWSREQIKSLGDNFNQDLLQGLRVRDLKKILLPLEKKLAVGAMSLWHTKMCEEHRRKPSLERPIKVSQPRRRKRAVLMADATTISTAGVGTVSKESAELPDVQRIRHYGVLRYTWYNCLRQNS